MRVVKSDLIPSGRAVMPRGERLNERLSRSVVDARTEPRVREESYEGLVVEDPVAVITGVVS